MKLRTEDYVGRTLVEDLADLLAEAKGVMQDEETDIWFLMGRLRFILGYIDGRMATIRGTGEDTETTLAAVHYTAEAIRALHEQLETNRNRGVAR